MRNAFTDKLNSFAENPDFCFLTGDLGFNALEELSINMGNRFINAGISEQNMLSVAAAFAKQNIECWAYSIAPFCYARAFEQIRNDICFHNLPVRIVGNGGGFGYGVMGPTHHAIEDYGILCSLPKIRSFIPVFNEDIDNIIDKLRSYDGPAYLRLGLDEKPKNWIPPEYAAWRQIISGNGPSVVVTGSIASSYIEKFIQLPDEFRPNMWILSELPIYDQLPDELIKQIKSSNRLIIVEEHVAAGGIAQQIALSLMINYNLSPKLSHSFARSHIFEKYGSQKYLRKCSNLDPDNLCENMRKMCK